MSKDNNKKVVTKNANASKKGSSKTSSIAISVGSVIVFVLIFISFIILPGLVGSGTKESPVFGKWGTKVVRYEQGSYFNQSLSVYGNQVRQMAEQYGEYYMDFFMRQAYQQAFNETIRRYAFIDFVESTGYKPSPKKIDRKMVDQFLDNDGRFSEKLYKNTPDDEKEKMRKRFEEDDTANRFYLDYFDKQVMGNDEGINFALSTSKQELAFINAMNDVSVTFDTVIFDKSDYPKSESAKYLKVNSDLFNRYYFKAISVESDSVAKKVLQQIKSGEIVFEDAIDEFSKKYYSTADGTLKNQYEYQIISTLANENDFSKIADLKKDELSPVVKTQTGYTIYKCTQERVAPDENDDALLEVVDSYIKSNEMGRVQDYFSVIADEFLANANATNFETACKDLGKEKQTVENFTLNFAANSLLNQPDVEISELNNISNNEDFLTKLFALNENEISDAIVLENAVVIVQAKNINKNHTTNISDYDYRQSVTNQDYNTISKKIFESKKFKNDFDSTYAKYFTQSK